MKNSTDSFQMTSYERQLCEIIRQSPRPAHTIATSLSDPQFIALAARTRTTTIVAHSHPNVPAEWRAAHDANQRRISNMLEQADEIAREANSPLILLENGAVARIWPCQGCFAFGDLDLLAAREDLPRIDRVLKSRGWTPCADKGRIVYRSNLSRFNLQTHWLTGIFSKLLKQPTFSELLDNSSGEGARMLNPEYMLMQLCAHAASHWYVGGPGIILYRDIAWYLQTRQINWSAFTELCQDFDLERIAFHALNIAYLTLRVEVPDQFVGKAPIIDVSRLFENAVLNASTKLNLLARIYQDKMTYYSRGHR